MRTPAIAQPASPPRLDWIRPAGRTVHSMVDHHLLLPLGGLLALLWANAAPESYFTFSHSLAFPVNEIGMALFFGLITQEILEATLRGGFLHGRRRWPVPMLAGTGAALGTLLVYLAYITWSWELVLRDGWATAATIDIALAYVVARAIFGRHPAVPFLLLAAVTTNLLALLAVSSRHLLVNVYPGGAAIMAVAIALAALLRRRGVRSFWPYVFGCGALSWTALYLDGVHPALALVPIVPFLPRTARTADHLLDAHDGAAHSPRHYEHVWTGPTHVVLFLFGLVNAGVVLSGYGTGTWAVLVAGVAGKTLGIAAGVAIALMLGLHLPAHLRWRELGVVMLLAAGGFTFALFAATAAYPAGPVLAELKLGAILTGIGVPLAIVAARLLRVGRFAFPSPLPRPGHGGRARAR